MTHPLHGCRLRLDRAKYHLDELDAHFRSYCARVQMGYYPEVKHAPWNLQVEGDPTFAVIVGETVQNLRTALDYLVYALILHTRGRKPRNMTQFPVSSNAGDFFRTRHQVSELPGELRRRIRQLQPYKAKTVRGDALVLLRRLSNADKHRLLLVIDTRLGEQPKVRQGVTLTPKSIGVVIPEYLTGSSYEQNVLRRNPNIAAVMYFSLQLGEAGGGDVFVVLKRLLWVVTEIIDGFEDAFV